MPKITRTVRGATLIETMAAMLLSCVLGLIIMEGTMLFFKIQTHTAETLWNAGRARDGYVRITRAIAGADSLRPLHDGVALYRNGRQQRLLLDDSTVVYIGNGMQDTLLYGIGKLGLKHPTCSDTVEIRFTGGFTACFTTRRSEKQEYEKNIETLEEDYGYED